MLKEDDTTADQSIAARVSTRGFRGAAEAARAWAWANPFVPVALTVAAVASHFLHRRGRTSRIGDAVDSSLRTAAPLLDPPQSTSRWRIPSPLASLRHRFIDRITRGARARRGETVSAVTR